MTPPRQRPAPRKSTLASRHPAEPVPAATDAEPAPPSTPEDAGTAAPQARPAPAVTRRTTTTTGGEGKPAKSGGKTKVGFYTAEANAARLRGAAKFIPNELRAQGITGFSALAEKLVMDGLVELERKYNGGKPFPTLTPGEELPRGRQVQ
ncbi:hypothetical protein [Georgenia muralis]